MRKMRIFFCLTRWYVISFPIYVDNAMRIVNAIYDNHLEIHAQYIRFNLFRRSNLSINNQLMNLLGNLCCPMRSRIEDRRMKGRTYWWWISRRTKKKRTRKVIDAVCSDVLVVCLPCDWPSSILFTCYWRHPLLFFFFVLVCLAVLAISFLT